MSDTAKNTEVSRLPLTQDVRPVAVIDVGSTAIRMTLAQIDAAGKVHPLESLHQAVSLGKDTFTRGRIETTTAEECVRALRSFSRILKEYQITSGDQIRAVATSAVREAINRQTFVDRLYIGTGIRVEVIDEAEVTRLTYIGVLPFLEKESSAADSDSLVIEVGGGSTELLFLQSGKIVFSGTFRLGSLRLREMLETYRAPAASQRTIMMGYIERTIEQIKRNLTLQKPPNMIAMGGDARFAAAQLQPDWKTDSLARLSVSSVGRFVDTILPLSTADLVRQYHLSFPDAETAAPALLSYVLLARSLQTKNILVTSATMRDGLLMEMAAKGAWTDKFREQIIQSAIDLGRRYHFEEAHALHTLHLCRILFQALAEEHRLDPRYELVLSVAALLHDVGQYVNSRSHHKHSMYLILNSELFGLGRKDLFLAALVARYHRKASPQPIHEGYGTLDLDNRVAVAKLAAILRVADALDRSGSQRVREITCAREDGSFVITIPNVEDLSLEQFALKQKESMFEEVYGMTVALQKAPGAGR